MRKLLNPSPESNLWSTEIFKLVLVTPLTLAVLLAAVAGWNEWDRALPWWAWNGDAYTEFLKIHRLPIGVLAALIPLLALVAANHRSIQSAANLKAQLAHNAFTNYYTHRDLFEHFALDKAGEAERHIDTHRLHQFLYPEGPAGILQIDPNLPPAFSLLSINIIELWKLLSSDLFDPSLPEASAPLISRAECGGVVLKIAEVAQKLAEIEIAVLDSTTDIQNKDLKSLVRHSVSRFHLLESVSKFDSSGASYSLADTSHRIVAVLSELVDYDQFRLIENLTVGHLNEIAEHTDYQDYGNESP
ncbi:MAG: hypothetical protein AAGI72_19375 [Pseudomonadota bacterium]